jgi:hypothetical protein
LSPGVVAREATLLPRHWDWLNSQPGGTPVALRKLAEEARRPDAGKDRVRVGVQAAYRFVSAMAGNEPGPVFPADGPGMANRRSRRLKSEVIFGTMS